MGNPRKKHDKEDLPPWTGNDAALKTWTIAELDKDFREFVEGAKVLGAILKREPTVRIPAETEKYLRRVGLPTTPRSKAEKAEGRKRWLTIGKRELREWLEQRAIAESDIKALRKLHPKLEPFMPIKPKRKRPFGDHDWQGLSPEDCLTEALREKKEIRKIWKKKFRKTNRPRGTLTADEIVAKRWGLTKEDVRKRRISLATRKRLAKQC
jgi:hypothetical protein